MPDWSYRTLFRPLLFRMPAAKARNLTLKTFGRLGRLPGGSFVIRTFGHMELSPVLANLFGDTEIKYPVGLSAELDAQGHAHRSLAQIGFGFIEVGPVGLRASEHSQDVLLDMQKEAVIYSGPAAVESVDIVLEKFAGNRRGRLPYMFRLKPLQGNAYHDAFSDIAALMKRLTGQAAAFYIDVLDVERTTSAACALLDRLYEHTREEANLTPLFLYVPLDFPMEQLRQLLKECSSISEWAGFVVGDGVQTDRGLEFGKEGKTLAQEKIKWLHAVRSRHQAIVCKAGIHEPQDALDMINAGARFVQLHSGLVFSGPGLPKRINEAILFEKLSGDTPARPPSFWKYWGWACLLGLGMLIGGILAWYIAVTSVLLPYDEAYLGTTGAEIHRDVPRLLHFMSHDRITLAGTMISIGIMYFMLGYAGLRRRLHWAKTALLASGIIGFSSFLLYLGYGYFDALHALAAAILLPMFILSMRERGDTILVKRPNVRDDRVWQLAQWGQLMFVILGFAFAVAGITISLVGVTDVFVREDLGFLQLTPDAIGGYNSRLLPLIAHDRAGFGGALLCDAVALLAAALWGIRQQERWIWWMFLLSGVPGFAAAFSVHWSIGYTDSFHLAPAYFALLIYAVGLFCLYPYLMGRKKA